MQTDRSVIVLLTAPSRGWSERTWIGVKFETLHTWHINMAAGDTMLSGPQTHHTAHTYGHADQQAA